MNSIEEAINLFEKGYMCSQAVFAAFCEDYNLPKEQALKIGACFGSGMRKGEVCGACTGALMVLGLKYGDDKAKSEEVCNIFLEEFERQNGSYICRDLLGCDIGTPEGVKEAVDKNLFKEFCPKMVESSARIVGEILK